MNMKVKIINRANHCISRKNIDKHALRVLYHLKKNNFQAYLVGGGVRDLLLKKQPKDFDIVTNATPHQIKNLFKRCRLIGKRFIIVHVYFFNKVIEVSTFRANITQINNYCNHGTIIKDNIYGTLEEDVWRRDFTINALYYTIEDFSILDFTGGIQDIESGIIRVIGDTKLRYREDPIRILRAIRFAAKLNIYINKDDLDQIPQMINLLDHVHPRRLMEESMKLFTQVNSTRIWEIIIDTKLINYLSTPLAKLLKYNKAKIINLITSIKVINDSPNQYDVSMLFATLLWQVLENHINKNTTCKGFMKISQKIINQQLQCLELSNYNIQEILSIWELQIKFNKQNYDIKITNKKIYNKALLLLKVRATINPQLIRLFHRWQ